mmetsp:Transcript_56750/g.175982  ORF Transcript_56750/g.175982 Transcript_56750/m.175982 type:complete len:86 (+) Transcript_56750:116-373(+)
MAVSTQMRASAPAGRRAVQWSVAPQLPKSLEKREDFWLAEAWSAWTFFWQWQCVPSVQERAGTDSAEVPSLPGLHTGVLKLLALL